MGIHGSATCVMRHAAAVGWLVGEENRGLALMFVMMNEARIGVGIQGLSTASTSYLNALSYAKDRVQGSAVESFKEADVTL
jgi:alkylation response protein AidB-like acyl-CoA dehydrogenase